MMKMTTAEFKTLDALAENLVDRVHAKLGDMDMDPRDELRLYLFVGTTFRAMALPDDEYRVVVQQLTDAAGAVASKMMDGASVTEALQGETPFCLQPELAS